MESGVRVYSERSMITSVGALRASGHVNPCEFNVTRAKFARVTPATINMECGRCMITMRMRVSFVIVISNHPAHVRHYFERGEREREGGREGERGRARALLGN